MAQADSQFTTRSAVLRNPETHLVASVVSPTAVPTPDTGAASAAEASDPIFGAIEDHKRELDRRNQTIEAICAAEDRHKAEERETWHRYEEASIALLTIRPTTMAGVIALLNYVALPECSGPGTCETILDGARTLFQSRSSRCSGAISCVECAGASRNYGRSVADIPSGGGTPRRRWRIWMLVTTQIGAGAPRLANEPRTGVGSIGDIGGKTRAKSVPLHSLVHVGASIVPSGRPKNARRADQGACAVFTPGILFAVRRRCPPPPPHDADELEPRQPAPRPGGAFHLQQAGIPSWPR